MKNKSLVEELEEEERKERETQVKKAKEAVLHALSIHLLASESRDIRDAYLYGLVFAAIADDGKVDVAETAILSEIATALSLPDGEVEEAVSELQTKCAKDKMQLITECVNALSGNKVGLNLFWAQFIQVWSSHADSKDNLSCLLKKIAEQSGVSLPTSKVSAILSLIKGGDGIDKDLLTLADWMGDDALKYFVVKKYGDVTDTLVNERKRQARAQARRRKSLLRKKAAQKLNDAIKFATRKYGTSKRISTDALKDIEKRVTGIDGDLIDWVSNCTAILDVESICERYSGVESARDKECRKKIWRLVTLLMIEYEPEYSVMCDKLNGLLVPSCIRKDDWVEKLQTFMSKYLEDRITLVDL